MTEGLVRGALLPREPPLRLETSERGGKCDGGMGDWGEGEEKGEENDEGEEATTAAMTALFLFPVALGQRSPSAKGARESPPLTLRWRGPRCCGGGKFGR